MLRRLEKGLNSAKLKSQSVSDSSLPASISLTSSLYPRSPTERFPNNELPPLNIPADLDRISGRASQLLNSADDDDDPDRVSEEAIGEIVGGVPVLNDDPEWRCHHWLYAAIEVSVSLREILRPGSYELDSKLTV